MPYEYSEVVLFELMVMREAENYSQALEHMGMFKASITDDLYLNETKGVNGRGGARRVMGGAKRVMGWG